MFIPRNNDKKLQLLNRSYHLKLAVHERFKTERKLLTEKLSQMCTRHRIERTFFYSSSLVKKQLAECSTIADKFKEIDLKIEEVERNAKELKQELDQELDRVLVEEVHILLPPGFAPSQRAPRNSSSRFACMSQQWGMGLSWNKSKLKRLTGTLPHNKRRVEGVQFIQSIPPLSKLPSHSGQLTMESACLAAFIIVPVTMVSSGKLALAKWQAFYSSQKEVVRKVNKFLEKSYSSPFCPSAEERGLWYTFCAPLEDSSSSIRGMK